MKTAIVFGASGLVGKQLIYELLEHSGYQYVKAVVRKPLPLAHPKLEQIINDDFTYLEPISSKLTADVFFCCIGTTIKKAGSQSAFSKVDMNIPIAIARFAESLQVPNLVIISSIGANAQSANFYLQTKGSMEQQVQNIYQGNLKIVRPSFLLGNRDEFRLGEKIAISIAKFIGILMIGPLAKYKGIEASDVAKAMIQLIDLPRDKVFVESNELHMLAKR